MIGNGTTPLRPRDGRRARRRRGLTAGATGLAVALGLGLTSLARAHAETAEGPADTGTAGAVTEPQGPEQSDFSSAFGYSLTHPTATPAGTNDWSCRPGQAHPEPVVLVHGTFENRYANWAALAPRLERAGYCVYALNYGAPDLAPLKGTGDIVASAGQLASFVDRVRTATGAAKVDLVGHSQGGLMPRYYLDRLGGAAKVDKLVALTPPNHGTTFQGLGLMARATPGADALLGGSCTACEQQVVGSGFLKDLNSGGAVAPDVDYTVIATVHDQVVTPFTSSYLGPAANVDNQTVQTYCLTDTSDHTDISYDPVATHLVLDALDPARSTRPGC
ncbi:esterase/lipase family protein [Streptomyces cinerochromogenes]|uniref:esterase/lipase family protein n=1 Tax=Streptomyces cinerochromogenes TaxID=66422 RepID=UPI00167082EC|nr:triacylglycerol lipase [Streptomyces cinerochromogenes]GGS81777.1 lipase [Streptomyces cinerochromogenes]